METESIAESKFQNYLIHNKGYSSTQIASAPLLRVGDKRSYRPDMAILSPSGKVIAVVEVKSEIEKIEENISRLKLYRESLGSEDLSLFLVIQLNETFKIYDITSETERKIYFVDKFPTYSELSKGSSAVNQERIESKARRIGNLSNKQKNIGIFALASLFVLDIVIEAICDFTILTAERLSVIGAIFVLMIVNHLVSLKAFGIEVSLHKEDEDNAKK